MTYFYDYFAKDYRERRGGELFSAPAAICKNIKREDVESCRRVLKNAFSLYREGRKVDLLKRLFEEYKVYVAGCGDECAKNIYNAFVYRYMLEVHVGSRAIAAKFGVSKETVHNYINRCIDEMLVLCMGIAATDMPYEKERAVGLLINKNRLFNNMAGDYVLDIFPGRRERAAVKQGRQITKDIMGQFREALKSYADYCNDKNTRIETDIRKAEVLQKCLDLAAPAAIAEEYGLCETSVYADIRENKKRLAAMLFDV